VSEPAVEPSTADRARTAAVYHFGRLQLPAIAVPEPTFPDPPPPGVRHL